MTVAIPSQQVIILQPTKTSLTVAEGNDHSLSSSSSSSSSRSKWWKQSICTSQHNSSLSSQPLLVPSYGKLFSFLATTCFLWLSEPLLALVDTAFVSWSQQGKEQLVVQLAAMGLATTFMDTLVYMTYFIAIATTTQIAELMALSNYRQLQISTSRLLGFAILCGSIVTVFTLVSARFWLNVLAGQEYDEQAPDMVPLAAQFVQIRALVAPLTVSGMMAHSFCLVTDHTGTVAWAVLASAVTNVALDLLLTPQYGMLGAACATASATSLSALILLRRVCLQMRSWRTREVDESTEESTSSSLELTKQISLVRDFDHGRDDGIDADGSGSCDSEDDLAENDTINESQPLQQHRQLQRHPIVSSDNTKSAAISNGNGIHGKDTRSAINSVYNKQVVPLVSLPDREALIQLLKLSLPLAFYMWAETASYASLTISATEYGPVALAAQNVLMQVFHVLCCISESLAQAAQAFLPSALYPRYHEPSYVEILSRLGRVAAVVAVLGYRVSLLLLSDHGNESQGGQHRWSSPIQDALDAPVVEQLQLTAPYLAACLCLHPFNAVIEGTVIATRDFGNIVKTYSVTLLVFGLILVYHVHHLSHVWRALVCWQVLRMFNYCWWRRRVPAAAAIVHANNNHTSSSAISPCTNSATSAITTGSTSANGNAPSTKAAAAAAATTTTDANVSCAHDEL